MKRQHLKRWSRALLCTLGLLATASVGCQSTVSGQTMPSAYYLRDDIQYFLAGQEDRYPEARRKLEQYRLDQQRVQEGLAEEP
ncbi:MAG: hypothetical protein Tsb009_00740 [Planctomycetaceae bacterium]